MHKNRVVLFDTETTGLNPEDRVIQLGLLVADKCDIFSYTHHEDFCKVSVPISISAMEINHITPEMLEGVDVINDTYSFNLLHECNSLDNYFVAHNIKFDLNVLSKEDFTCHAKIIDTQRCAKHLIKDVDSHRLQHLRYAIGLYKQDKFYPTDDIIAHSALGDVFTMHQLLNYLLDILKTTQPEKDPFEFLVELTNQPVTVTTFPFGKHKGELLYNIPTSYLNWALDNISDLSDDLRYSMELVLKENIVHKN